MIIYGSSISIFHYSSAGISFCFHSFLAGISLQISFLVSWDIIVLSLPVSWDFIALSLFLSWDIIVDIIPCQLGCHCAFIISWLEKDVPWGEKWDGLAKRGMAGIYVIVMALSWWIKVIETLAPEGEAWGVVQDLHWVLTQMQLAITMTGQGSQGAKRHNDSEGGKRMKWWGLFDLGLSTKDLTEHLSSRTAIVARFLYEILVTAHKLDIFRPATAHHPNFSHMLVLLLGSLEYIYYINGGRIGYFRCCGCWWEGGACRGEFQ